ncbi:flagellar hook-associated protein FlgK [Sphingomonas sp. LB-2]|uniref:flagellar hook-associated protein FlgK n=1 Tax=Sphingomonas caeni TaxID=2984949 RepID=UPI002232A4D3|nr:flagellar hook-associated protein FlgK [Sphingomonas caeni]MCW3846893.1 flagellar hook-associated protein FlgK [Sphingomonas caeni]
MSDLLSIAASGLRAYQTALTTVSENIANAGTAGYVRRTAALNEVAAPGIDSGQNGMGVVVTGINRAGDVYRSGEVRAAASDLGKTETAATWLDRIEGALTGDKLGDRLTAFFNSANTVAADPSAIAPRAAMLEAATSVASAFTGTGNALAAAAADLDQSADAAVSQLNSLAAGLAKVNAGLGRTAPGTAGAAALSDQRDQLLEAMSAITDVSASLDSAGRATVRVGGSSGPVMVQGDLAGTVTYVHNDEGAASYSLYRDGQASVLAPNAGALAGMTEGATRIAAARVQLGALAESFVQGVNAVQANGRDLNGNPGEPIFAAGSDPTQVSLALSDPRGVAAAAVGGGPRDNRNLANFVTLRRDGGFESQVTDLVTANASALSARRSVAEAQTAIHDSAVAARDSASGVNIDEEAVDLLRFQQAYQASARVIQIARETLQTMLDIK